jgi:hypothetical protein
MIDIIDGIIQLSSLSLWIYKIVLRRLFHGWWVVAYIFNQYMNIVWHNVILTRTAFVDFTDFAALVVIIVWWWDDEQGQLQVAVLLLLLGRLVLLVGRDVVGTRSAIGVGFAVGIGVGMLVGVAVVGVFVGMGVDTDVGGEVGTGVGAGVGIAVGIGVVRMFGVGSGVVGTGVGDCVGVWVGNEVGVWVVGFDVVGIAVVGGGVSANLRSIDVIKETLLLCLSGWIKILSVCEETIWWFISPAGEGTCAWR